MAVRASEIASYKGDVAGGLARSGALDAFEQTQTDQMSQTARDLAIQSFAANQILYKQRIADRDAAYKMLDDDQLIPNNILEEHRPVVDQKLKKVQDIFYKSGGDVVSDPKRFREFNSAIQDAKSTIKQAQKWYLGVNADLDTKSKMDSPVDQARVDQHVNSLLDKSKKDFYGLPDPYVPISHFNLGVVAAPADYSEPVVTRTGSGANAVDITEQKLDPINTFNSYQKRWSQPGQTHMFQEYIDRFLTGPNADADVVRINNSLAGINEKLGLKPGDQGYVAPLGVQPDKISGHYVASSDRYDQIAAKIAMADAEAVKRKTDFSNQRAQAVLEAQKNAITDRHNRAMEGIDWAKIAAQKEEWGMKMKGGETTKNDAMTFAQRIVKELAALGIQESNGNITIPPDKMRQLTGEQLKYLGIDIKYDNGKPVGLQPLETTDKDVIQITPDFKIKYLTGAEKYTLPDGTVGYKGMWDPKRTTSVFNIATNRLNEENMNSGSKELNNYVPIDVGNFQEAVNTTGGSVGVRGGQSTRGGTTQGGLSNNPADWTKVPDGKGGSNWKYKDGNIYDATGKVIK